MPEKKGAWTVFRFKLGLRKKEGGEVNTPMHSMGAGAVIKHAIKDTMYNPDDPHYTIDQLLHSGLQDHLPSVKIVVYFKDDVISIERKLPDIQSAVGTTKIHDVLVESFRKT